MIARAGGVAIEPSVAVVRVTRGSQTGQVWMQDLFANPNLDIALRGGDKLLPACRRCAQAVTPPRRAVAWRSRRPTLPDWSPNGAR